jgi:hypothetical protein
MTYETVKHLSPGEFKRLTGVSPETFESMLGVLSEKLRDFGRPRELPLADHLMVTLLYWREYRTQFHMGVEFGVSESTISRIIRKVEDVLAASGEFRLPGEKALKALRGEGVEIEAVLVDVTETPVERPKKNSGGTTAARRGATPRRPSS